MILSDYLTAPSYHFVHHPTLMLCILVSAGTVLLCALAQLVHLSGMFQSWPWCHKKFLVTVLGIVLPISLIYFCCTDTRYRVFAQGLLVNTTELSILVDDGSEKWTVPPDGNQFVTIGKWDVQAPPQLAIQGVRHQVPSDSVFIAVHGSKRVHVEQVFYHAKDDPAARIKRLEIMLGILPEPDNSRLLGPGVTAIGRVGDSLFPPGESAPTEMDSRTKGAFFEVNITAVEKL